MNQIDLTAKVLAQENITVIRKNVRTAAFELKTRTLILPTWKDMTPEAEMMLTFHEVSHALYTPDQYMDELKENRRLQSYLNVLEDIRCEKLFQENYPGSRKDFIVGYKAMLDRDFFGLSKVDPTDLNLIDRINVFFKVGLASGIKFNRGEQKFLDRIRGLVTFQNVVDLAKEIYESEKDRLDKQKEEADNNEELQEELTRSEDEGDDFEMESGDYFGDDEEDEEDEDGEESESGATENDEEDEESDMDGINPEYKDDELDATTQDNFDNQLKDCTDENYNPTFTDLTPLDFDYIIPYKKVLARYISYGLNSYNTDFGMKFKQNSNKQVAHIAQQFELKKAADAYSRSKVTKSGVLDVNRVATYKINSDVFRRNVKVPNGQNHGMVMLLDWSGSMACHDKITHSIRQAIQLALFCKKVNIPYRIYAFATTGEWSEIANQKGFWLMELLSNEMNNKEFNTMVDYLVSPRATSPMRLGSTPMAPALVAMLDIIPEFKAKYRLDKVSLIAFSDGENTTNLIDSNYTTIDPYKHDATQDVFIKDPVTKKNYKIGTKGDYYLSRTTQCTKLFEMIKDRYNVNIISFMVAMPAELYDAHKYLGSSYGKNWDQKKVQFMKDKFLTVNVPGRDAAYIVHPKMLEMEEMSTAGISGDMTSAQISRTLMKTSKKSLKAKVLLEKFISVIS